MKGFKRFRTPVCAVQLGLGLLLLGAGCAQPGPASLKASAQSAPEPVPPPSPPSPLSQSKPTADFVLVECRLLDGGAVLSAPRILTLSGREAQISIEHPVTLPDERQVPAGLSLRIVPKIEGASVVFQGQCAVRQLTPDSASQGLQTTTWTARETWFSGTAPLDELVVIRMSAGDSAKDSLGVLVQLRFSRVPRATSRARP